MDQLHDSQRCPAYIRTLPAHVLEPDPGRLLVAHHRLGLGDDVPLYDLDRAVVSLILNDPSRAPAAPMPRRQFVHGTYYVDGVPRLSVNLKEAHEITGWTKDFLRFLLANGKLPNACGGGKSTPWKIPVSDLIHAMQHPD